ncbi:hypothetical protein N0V88_001657 [Collariella sp. IMI 366227]|nr:hypothetical protein N0V88_001657 [Collariella sp. IMI 366227]
MSMGNGMEATDERDRIFALVGLACDADRLGLRPDYSIEGCAPLFTNVARALIRENGRLDVLLWSQFPKASYPRLKTPLPSWVPDWRPGLAPSYVPEAANCADRCVPFSASKGSSPIFEDATDKRILGLKGLKVCTIEKVGDECKKDGGVTALAQPLNAIAAFCDESAALNHGIYASPMRRKEAAWRVPIGDLYRLPTAKYVRVDSSTHPVDDQHAAALTLSKIWAGKEAPEFDADTLDKGVDYLQLMSVMKGKAPFLSRRGYVGMGPPKMAAGDVIVIFSGAHIPHILRRSVNRNNHWEYVGEAYCDGVMDGEAWDESKRVTFFLV